MRRDAPSTVRTKRRGDVAVTRIIDRIPHSEEEAQLEKAIQRLNAAAAQYEGFLGVTVTRPAQPAQPGFRIVYRFDSPEHLAAWEESQERIDLVSEADGHTVGAPRTEVASGLETWLTLPPHRPFPTSRLRLATVSWLGIFPLVVVFVAVADLLLPSFIHPVLSLALVTAIVVLVMTYFVGPGLTKLFQKWLRRET
jgi:antibiotic biosynthesis monooxygenase (ABM) superfamily enzyme